MTTQLRGADVLAQALARARYLFSLSGNQVMPLYDARSTRRWRLSMFAMRARQSTWPTPGDG